MILVGYPTLQDMCSSLLCHLLMFGVYVHCIHCLYWLFCSHASFGIYKNNNGLSLVYTLYYQIFISMILPPDWRNACADIYKRKPYSFFFFFFKGSEKIYIYTHTHDTPTDKYMFGLYYITFLINKLALKESIFCCCLTTFLHWWVTVNRAIISLTWNFVSFSL